MADSNAAEVSATPWLGSTDGFQVPVMIMTRAVTVHTTTVSINGSYNCDESLGHRPVGAYRRMRNSCRSDAGLIRKSSPLKTLEQTHLLTPPAIPSGLNAPFIIAAKAARYHVEIGKNNEQPGRHVNHGHERHNF